MAARTPATPSTPSNDTTADATARPPDGFSDEEEENGPWRHPPVAPKDEGIARSLGKSISDVVTGPLDDASGKPKTP